MIAVAIFMFIFGLYAIGRLFPDKVIAMIFRLVWFIEDKVEERETKRKD